jgi:hypothetical protein
MSGVSSGDGSKIPMYRAIVIDLHYHEAQYDKTEARCIFSFTALSFYPAELAL